MKHRGSKKSKARSGRARRSAWMTVGTLMVYAAFGSRAVARAESLIEERNPKSRKESPSPPIRRFDIPAGPLDTVIAAFEKASGAKVVLSDPSMGALWSAGLSGSFTDEQALVLLLTGTGITPRFTSGAVVLAFRIEDRVDVTAGDLAPSSPKYTQPWRDIPQTITVIPRSLWTEQSATTLRDVLRNVPGITMQAGEGGVPAGDNLTIRGFNARTDMFIDGVRDFGGYSRDAFNLEQVEVTKGPSSSVSGRGSTGGSVNLVSKTPSSEPTHALDVAGGSAHHKRGALDVNESVGGGRAAIRLNALYQETGVAGRDPVESNRWGLAPSVSVGLRSRTRATLSYFRLDQNGLPDYGLPWVPESNIPLAAYANQPPPVDFGNFYGLTTRDYEKTATEVSTFVLRYDASAAFSLRNLSRFGRTRRDSVITAPRFASPGGTDLNRQLQSRDQNDTIAANQTDVTAHLGDGRMRHSIAAGVEIANETSKNHLRTGPPAPLADLFAPVVDAPYAGPIVRTGAVNQGRAKSLAGYLFDTVQVERIEVTGGVRVDRFDVDYTAKDADGEMTERGRNDVMVSYRAGVVYKLRPNGSLYAGAGTSFNPSAEGLSLSASTVGLEPEKTRNFEIGTKWDLSSPRLSMSASLFRTEKTNARTPGVNPGDPATVLQGEQRVDGVEVGLSGRLTPGWQAFAAFSYMDSEVVLTNAANQEGNDLGLVPRASLNLWTTVALPLGLSVGAGVQYMDNVFRNTQNVRSAPGYWLLSATASREINQKLTLRLNLSNLADRNYIDRVGGGHFIPGAGRAVVVTAAVKF